TQCGVGNAINLRRDFERNLHLTPSDYRERFCARMMA
ncbi:GlxA family transcriptional regulator, partial [Leptospira borgpetersenii serovar Ballum]|nr:GlxA family transcriptional regulator [Leptospira borgpetersenii serovar Ballum]